ncbi:MAG TPA: amidohydrolase [Acidobacteriaceae bacterium]|nr:amidohydrolase [Acidobacteriaceae bacterium]
MKSITLAAISFSALSILAAPASAQRGPQPARWLGSEHCPQPAHTIYYNGNILTGVGLHAIDDHTPPQRVQAIGISGEWITAVGSNDTVLACAAPDAVKIDLHGAFAMPGFNDAHTHIAEAGLDRLSANLNGVTSLAEMQSRIAAYAKTLPDPNEWILGGGWDHTRWASKTLPTAHDLDSVTGPHPAFLFRVDGHIAIANTAALKAAGIDNNTPDPPGGHIDRDAQGNPTGIIRESPATSLVEKVIPPPSYQTRRHALELSIQDALAHGVTSIQDFSTWNDWLVLEGMEHENKLPLRIAEWIDFNLPLGDLEQRRASHDPNDPLLHLTFLKGFMDGSLGSRTAALNAPYSDDPNNSGIPRYDPDKLNAMSTERAAAGFQLGFHAIGDRANDMALDAFEAAEQAGIPAPAFLCQAKEEKYEHTLPPDAIVTRVNPCPQPPYAPADFRFRIEHAQVVSPNAFQRFHDLGVIASMQPSHLLDDMAWAEQRLGPANSDHARIKYAYAWRSFLNHGVPLAFGTDYPVESINPMRGLYAAITRMNEAGTQTFDPQNAAHEKLTVTEALYAYTQASAFAEWRETIKGQLAPGFLADLVVLDRDLTRSTPQQILHTRVLRTVVGGITRYTAEQSTPAAPPSPAAQQPTAQQPAPPAKPSPYAKPTNPDARTGTSHPPDNPD